MKTNLWMKRSRPLISRLCLDEGTFRPAALKKDVWELPREAQAVAAAPGLSADLQQLGAQPQEMPVGVC